MSFKKSEIDKLSQKAKYFEELGAVFDEENTKTCFVMPFFLALGYDVFNPLEFMAELNMDTRYNGTEKVDYAICVDFIPRIIIEVKKKGSPLKRSIGQLKRYFNSDVRVQYGILTNGIDYYFFTDNVNQNIMDDHPYYMLNLLQLKKDDMDFLKLLTKENVWNIFSKKDRESNIRTNYELPDASGIKKDLKPEYLYSADDMITNDVVYEPTPKRTFKL